MVSRPIRTIFWTILSFSILAGTLYFLPVDPKQKLLISGQIPNADLSTITNLDSLRSLFGKNKFLAPGFEIQCLLALSAYPELTDVSIEFILQDDGVPMESTVDYLSMIGPARKRKYKILLNDNPNSFFSPILLRNLPFNAQVGILAHELGHTQYYHELNTFQVISWAMNYGLNQEFQSAHERSTDALVIYRGMGWQILRYAEYVRYDSTTEEFYFMESGFMDTYYLHPNEIQEIICALNSYQSP